MESYKKTKLSYAIKAIALGSMVGIATSAQVFAQEAEGQTVDTAKKMDKVTVTGSHIKMIDTVSTSPIQVISRADIDRSGAGTVAELLSKITANNGGSFPESFNNGFADGATGVSLRGLGVNRTLVLINNRRVASFSFGQDITESFTDINAISLDSIDRVEVLLDGASAVYGSDAITGVVNFILRSDFDGMQISGQTYDTKDGGGEQTAINVMWGKVTDKGSIVVNVDHFSEDYLYTQDRAWGRVNNWSEFDSNVDNDPWHYYGPTGQANYYLGYVNPFFGVESNGYTAFTGVGGADACTDGRYEESASGRSLYCKTLDNLVATPEKDRTNVMINATYSLGDIDLFADLQYNQSETHFNYRSAFNWLGTFANMYGALPDGSGAINNAYAGSGWSWYATEAFGGDFVGDSLPGTDVPIADVTWVMSDLGDAVTIMETENIRVSMGAAGVFADVWDWEANAIYSLNEADIVDTNKAHGPTLLSALNSYDYFYIGGLDLTPWGIDVTETNSQATLDSIRRSTTDTGRSEMTQVSFVVSNSSYSMEHGNLGLAFGIEGRSEEIENIPDAQLVAGEIFNSGSRSEVRGDRDILAVYGEAVIPLLEDLDVTFALRHEDYSDFGQTTNPKIGVRWQPNDWFLARFNWGTGFRAPGMMELYLDDAVSFSQYKDHTRCAEYDAATESGQNDGSQQDSYCFANYNQTNFGSNPDLAPEESESMSIGIVFSPTDTMTLGFDLWDVEITDVIDSLAASDMVFEESRDGSYGSNINRQAATQLDLDVGVTSGDILTVDTSYFNLNRLTARGVDINFDWVLDTKFGRFNPYLTSTYMDDLTSESPFVGDDQWLGFNGYPRWKAQYGMQWSKDDWSFAVQGYYRHAMTDYDSSQSYTLDGESVEIRSHNTYNLSLAYEGIENMEVSVQVINAMNKAPAFSTVPYGGVNMSDGIDGRGMRLTVRYDLF